MNASGDPPVERRTPITVVLVDDEPLIRASLARALSDAGLELLGEADNGHDALGLVLDLRPDVVLTDIRLPGMSGVEMIERIGLLAPATRVLVLARSEKNQVVEAILAGASGYIVKTAPPDAIIRSLRATAKGDSALSPEIAGKLLEHIREHELLPVIDDNGQAAAANAIRAALTARELEIFTRLASGQSNQEIGAELSLSTHTISNHIKSILDKLHLENRIQAAVQAVRAGIS